MPPTQERGLGGRCMASGGVPDAWIGERVSLRYWRGDGKNMAMGKLEAVGEHGVVIAYQDAEISRFYPWSAVLHIEHPVGGEEQERPRRQARAVSLPR